MGKRGGLRGEWTVRVHGSRHPAPSRAPTGCPDTAAGRAPTAGSPTARARARVDPGSPAGAQTLGQKSLRTQTKNVRSAFPTDTGTPRVLYIKRQRADLGRLRPWETDPSRRRNRDGGFTAGLTVNAGGPGGRNSPRDARLCPARRPHSPQGRTTRAARGQCPQGSAARARKAALGSGAGEADSPCVSPLVPQGHVPPRPVPTCHSSRICGCPWVSKGRHLLREGQLGAFGGCPEPSVPLHTSAAPTRCVSFPLLPWAARGAGAGGEGQTPRGGAAP